MAILETVSVQQAAELVRVNRDTIYQAIKRDELRAVDCEGKTRVIKDDLATFTVRGPGRPETTKKRS